MANRGRARTRPAEQSGEKLLAVEVDGERYTIDSRAFTIGEKQLMKRELSRLGYEADDIDWIAASVWIIRRREDRQLSFADAMESMTIGDIQDREVVDAEVDSPEA